MAKTTVIRPGICDPIPATAYRLKAARLSEATWVGNDAAAASVKVYLENRAPGWASRRLAARFDIQRAPDQTIVANGGAFCTDR